MYKHKHLLNTAMKILIFGCTLLFSLQVPAETIAIIGTGQVAAALGPRFAATGNTIIYGSREPDSSRVRKLVTQTGAGASATTQAQAAASADIIILAFRWSVAQQVIKALGDLSGKILIDPINPYRPTEDGLAGLAVKTSAGEIIQGWVPRAHVVKAFNTLGAGTMADPSSAGGTVTIPIVGNDAAAKARVAKLVESIGFDTIDLGPIRYAHEVEGMLLLWINARIKKTPFNFYLRREKQ